MADFNLDLHGVMIPSDEFYDEIGLEYEKVTSHDATRRAIVADFLRRLSPRSDVLDCGCGTGRPATSMIASAGHKAYGIDWSQAMIKRARERVPSGDFTQTNMLEYEPRIAFGGIIACLSLFEMGRGEITAMAKKWFDWLSPGGLLLIGVIGAEDCETKDEMWNDDRLCASGIPFMFMKQTVHMTLFTKKGWDILLEHQGFEVLHTKADLFTPPAESGCWPEVHYYVIAQKPNAEAGKTWISDGHI